MRKSYATKYVYELSILIMIIISTLLILYHLAELATKSMIINQKLRDIYVLKKYIYMKKIGTDYT